MNIAEMVWGLVVLLIGLVLADFYLVRRSTNRAVDALLKRPVIRKLNELLNDPAFERFAVDTIHTIHLINKKVKELFGGDAGGR